MAETVVYDSDIILIAQVVLILENSDHNTMVPKRIYLSHQGKTFVNFLFLTTVLGDCLDLVMLVKWLSGT